MAFIPPARTTFVSPDGLISKVPLMALLDQKSCIMFPSPSGSRSAFDKSTLALDWSAETTPLATVGSTTDVLNLLVCLVKIPAEVVPSEPSNTNSPPLLLCALILKPIFLFFEAAATLVEIPQVDISPPINSTVVPGKSMGLLEIK